MATAADIKAANGHTARGPLPKNLITAWNEAHPDDPYQPGPAREHLADARPDYPDDDFDAQFPDAPAEEMPAETAPRRPGRTRGSSPPKSTSWFRKSPKRPGKKPPRVSTADLLGGLWRAGAKLAAPLPPLQRTLRVQAPVAGMLLEDAVKDTVIDPLIQPLARLATAGKTINALAGPPMWVTVISVHAAQRAALTPPQGPHPMFMAIAEEGLRSSLMAWCEVSAGAFEQALKRERDFEEKYGQTVDDMMQFLFAPPPAPGDAEAVQAEEDAIRRAQGIL